MKSNLCVRMLALIVIILACACVAFPQEFRATLSGHISDPSGASVSGATVTVKNLQTGEQTTATTGEDGNYTLAFLMPALYSVSVEASGFKRVTTERLELHTNDKATLDVALEIGALENVVVVSPDELLLERDTATRGQVIENRRVTELPLNGRNPIMLATLSPGVQFNGNPQFTRPFDNGDNAQFSINGGIQRHNEFLLDGAPNNAITDADNARTRSSNNIAYIPPVDATQEFKVQTSSYDAQFGRTGGGVINVTTKSGGSEWHGTAYEFARRYELEANFFENNARNIPRFAVDPNTKENLGGRKLDQYGGNFSGPIHLPRFGEGGPSTYSGKDNAFFFFAFERYREAIPAPRLLNVPTVLERSGDFSQSGITIFDPLTTRPDPANPGRFIRDPFPGNVIPANRISPVGLAIINGFSLPNTGSATQRFNNFYLSEGLGTDDFYSNVARVDHTFSDNQSMFVRFVNNRRDQFAFGGNNRVGLGTDQQGPLVRENYGVVIDSTTTINPTTIFNARLGFARFLQAAFRKNSSPFDATSIGFSPAFSNARPISIVPRITFSDPNGGIPEFGSRNPNSNITNTWTLPAYLTKVTGNHTFRIGGEWRRFQVNQSGGSFNFGGGAFCFSNQFSARDPQNRSSGGAAFADLLLGAPSANAATFGCNGNAAVT